MTTDHISVAIEKAKVVSTGMYDQANALVVVTPSAYTQAGELRISVKARLKEIQDLRMSITRPIEQSLGKIRDLFRQYEDRLTQTVQLVDTKILGYQKQAEEIARQDELRLRQEAAKEQEKLTKKAEKAADKLEAKGQAGLAEQVRASVPEVPMPVVQAEIPKVKGLSTREVWKYRVIDHANVPREFLCVDEKKLGQFARATKGSINVQGVEFYKEDAVASGSGKPESGTGEF